MSEDFKNYLANKMQEVTDESAEVSSAVVENKAEELPQEETANDPVEDDEDLAEVVTEKVSLSNGFDCLVIMPTGSADRVLEEMQKRAEQDESIANGLADKSKSIKGCVDYICNQMRKFANKGNSSLFVTDDEVFGLAVHYYTETNEMLGISKAVTKPKADKPKVEKKADKVVALDPKTTKPTPKKKEEQTLELSLF